MAEMPKAGEVVGVGAVCASLDLVHGAEKDLPATEGAGVGWQWCLYAGDGDGVRGEGAGLGAWGSVAHVGVNVGAEEGDNEDGGEGFDDPTGLGEADHLTGRVGERVGHGSFRLCSASYAWI